MKYLILILLSVQLQAQTTPSENSIILGMARERMEQMLGEVNSQPRAGRDLEIVGEVQVKEPSLLERTFSAGGAGFQLGDAMNANVRHRIVTYYVVDKNQIVNGSYKVYRVVCGARIVLPGQMRSSDKVQYTQTECTGFSQSAKDAITSEINATNNIFGDHLSYTFNSTRMAGIIKDGRIDEKINETDRRRSVENVIENKGWWLWEEKSQWLSPEALRELNSARR
ncbi:MAG: hypothetical protein COW01_00450 [Bdellovibrionales bacterium CG12_big_fil_rev_8_21_14_0_65_38_15]|nr:MAG: hypothetical protein COW79_09980 [Bdellovibrionales bacterium CG22_combo_CG10-13_8_21_14_all_38_13]PIQ57437.1 MAG: hypothetical protein COW01_00450 [Bdellovibrionales bacterium CG12_big_fil_rev_8_21_14_0_65_38_15]PIR31158.1 MAG: hypothetical protein COV38_01930 [Bdellovibrionales bacterium CG11_big_fil_rev_8_21_14_0_20_38_13]